MKRRTGQHDPVHVCHGDTHPDPRLTPLDQSAGRCTLQIERNAIPAARCGNNERLAFHFDAYMGEKSSIQNRKDFFLIIMAPLGHSLDRISGCS